MSAVAAFFKLFGALWLAEQFGKQGGTPAAKGGKGGAAAASQPWPAAAPATLPPFPDGWEMETSPPDEVQKRAAAIAPQLWATGPGSTAQEMTGGRWITYQATQTPGASKGVVAWHVKGTATPGPTAAALVAPAAAAPAAVAPTVVPVGPQAQAKLAPAASPAAAPAASPAVETPAASPAVTPASKPSTALTPVQNAAIAMTNALNANGYRQSDQPIYKAFQRYGMGAATPDGFPGTHTMAALYGTLDQLGLPKPNVKIYPWLAAPGYDGVNAPTLSEWNR